MINTMKKLGLVFALGLMVTACGGGGGGAGTAVAPQDPPITNVGGGEEVTKSPALIAAEAALAAEQTALDAISTIAVSNTYAIKPQGSQYVIYNVDTNTDFGTFSSITGALGYSTQFDGLADSANYEQFDADGNLVGVYSYVDGDWTNILPAHAVQVATAEADVNTAGVSLINTAGFTPSAIGANGYGATTTSNSAWDIVNGDNSDSYFINDIGTGTPTDNVVTSTLINSNADTASSFSDFYKDVRDAHTAGWDGSGFRVVIGSGTNGSVTGDIAPGAASVEFVVDTHSCVVPGIPNSCTASNGIEVGSDKAIDLTNQTDGVASDVIYANVAAGVSLVWHKFDTLTNDQITDLVNETATEHSTGKNIINLGKALSPVGNLN